MCAESPIRYGSETAQRAWFGPPPLVPEVEVADDESAGEVSTRSRRTETLWADVRIDPVEIALPGGVGYTLRAYRPAGELAASEAEESDLDDYDAASAAVHRRRRAVVPEEEVPEEDLELDEDEDEDDEEEDDEDEDDEDEDDEDLKDDDD